MARKTRKIVGRHTAAAAVAVVAVAIFWASRPQWSTEMRAWKAVGDAALVLLLFTMGVGPGARLWRPAGRLLAWRRETGIWFALVSAVHVTLVLDGWTRWSVSRFLGYELVPQLGRVARMEPGFGLANAIGLIALVWALVLAATSSDRALRTLGPSAWKWLHNGSYVVFWLVAAHTWYFLFLHFTQSFHRPPYPPDWFRIPFTAAVTLVAALQAAAFLVTVRSRRRRDDTPYRGAASRSRTARSAASR